MSATLRKADHLAATYLSKWRAFAVAYEVFYVKSHHIVYKHRPAVWQYESADNNPGVGDWWQEGCMWREWGTYCSILDAGISDRFMRGLY